MAATAIALAMKSSVLLVLLASLATAAMVSGCTAAGAAASVVFDGKGNGVNDDSAKCRDKGTLTGSGHVDDGQVTVRVTDGDGHELLSKTYQSGDIPVDAKGLAGNTGTWTVEATRSGSDLFSDFNGHYTFRLDC
jgi:hypothetical protein